MSRNVKGTLLTLTGASCWGLCAVSAKFLISERGLDPVWIICLRLILSGLVLLIIGFAQNSSPKYSGQGTMTDILKKPRSLFKLIIIAIFAFAVCQTTYFAAIGLSNAGVVSVIQQTAPIFVMIYSIFVVKRKPAKVELISLVLVLSGAFLLATHGDAGSLVIPIKALVLAVISAITCACYTIMPAQMISEYGTFQTVGWGMLLGGLFLVPICRLWEDSGTWDIKTVLAFGYVVILGTLIAFGFFLYGITMIGPVKGSILALIEPVMATLMSVIVLKQHYMLVDYTGIAIILAGVALLSLSGGSESNESA